VRIYFLFFQKKIHFFYFRNFFWIFHSRKSFQFKKEIEKHVGQVHHGKRPFRCDLGGCGKAFTRSSYLNKHMAV
jgi:uncharacterized Zn-finger protein